MMIKFNSALLALLLIGCSASSDNETPEVTDATINTETENVPVEEEKPLYCNADVQVAAERTTTYFESLQGLRIGVVGNQSSMVGETHLVDTLLGAGLELVRVFSPEHGFRGTADAGEHVSDEIDEKTGLEIVSLHGKNKKPQPNQLEGIDILVFDIQDVGVRFYTYISTLHYVMEAAAENDKKVMVLDRPNPNGHYVDGPVLNLKHSSFIGMHEVPVVHGMTVGEYAQMINGQKWLEGGLSCDLEVIPCSGWDHASFYELPIAPSPNLPTMTSIYLYPSLCFFEGTIVSIGRGTDYPFQVIGHPGYKLDSTEADFQFVPEPNFGAKSPKLQGETCFGIDLHEADVRTLREKGELNLSYLISFYENMGMGKSFFLSNNFIDLLAGNSSLRASILQGESLESIRGSWTEELEAFKEMRKQYLLYPEG